MKPGSKVICVDDHFYELVKRIFNVFPKKGMVYTVKAIIPDPLRKNPPGIVLEELNNPSGETLCRNGVVVVEYSFRADRFVPQAKKEEPWGEAFFHLKNPLAIPSIQN